LKDHFIHLGDYYRRGAILVPCFSGSSRNADLLAAGGDLSARNNELNLYRKSIRKHGDILPVNPRYFEYYAAISSHRAEALWKTPTMKSVSRAELPPSKT
jgi:hypothetical protein